MYFFFRVTFLSTSERSLVVFPKSPKILQIFINFLGLIKFVLKHQDFSFKFVCSRKFGVKTQRNLNSLEFRSIILSHLIYFCPKFKNLDTLNWELFSKNIQSCKTDLKFLKSKTYLCGIHRCNTKS